MVATMKNEKNSLVLLSSKRTKADTRTRADEAFALPSFPEAAAPMFQMELPPRSCKEVAMEHHHGKGLENLKQTMLQHEAMFKEQVRELHRLYQVQRLLMAASKEKVVNISSDPASSSSSLVNNSEFVKPGGDRGPSEAVSRSKINFNGKYQNLASMPGQFTPADHQIHVNASQEGVPHLEEFCSLKYHKKEPRRPTFDLERPAEEYIDVDYGEEKSPEGDKLPYTTPASKISYSTTAPVSQSPLSGNDAHWSSSMGFDRETVDTVCRGLFGKNATLAEENGGDNHFLFQLPGSGNVSSFSMVPSRLDCPSQEALAFPTPVLSTKSLLGGLLGHKHEGQLEDKMMSDTDMQFTHSTDYEGRRVDRRFSEAETDQRTTQENSTPPQWFLQGQTCPMKTRPSQAMTQNSGWHQQLPFFLQKQDDLGLPRKHSVTSEENISPTVSQELTKAGNAWPNNGTNFYKSQIRAMGSQDIPSSGLSPTRSTHMPYRIFPQVGDSSSQSIPVGRDDKGAHIFPVFMSNYPSTPAVDMPAPVLDTHAASVMFSLGFSSRGSVHNPTTQPWFQQNGLSPPMQQQQVARLQTGSLPLTGERSLPGDYKVEGTHSLGLADVSRSNLHGPSNVTNDASYSIMQTVPLTARPEWLSKEAIFGNKPSTTNVELTLGLSTNKANKDPSCFGQTTVKQEQFDRLPFSGDGFERKAQTGKVQPREVDSLFSESCAGHAKIKATHNGFQHGIETIKSTSLHEASSINVLELGLSQNETDAAVREGKKMVSLDAENVKEVLQQQRKDQFGSPLLPKVITSKKHDQNVYQNAAQHPREQFSVHGELQVVSSLGECNDGNSRHERALNQHRQRSVSVAECAFSGAADRTFGSTGREIIMLGKCSDVPLVESPEVREAIPPAMCNPIDEVISGCGEACQSHEAGYVHCERENAPLSHMQIAADVCGEAGILLKTPCDTYMSPIMCSSLAVFKSEIENDILRENHHDSGDDRESDNSRKHEDEVPDHSNQAAEVLLSLAFDLSSVREKKATEDYAVHTQESSLEWFANVIPREDESGMMLGNKDAAGSFQPVDTLEGIRSAFEQLGEVTSRNSEISVEDRPNEVQSPKKLDFFETVTLMLTASGLDTGEINLQAIDRWQMEGECQSVAAHSGRSSRRGRVGKDFQREMLPSIASLARHEITEDIQTLGGLVRSATEMVAMRSASCPPLKEDDSWTPTDLDSITPGGTKGHCMNLVTKSSKTDETENQNGFLRISSWGELTRRRRMRRHRSRWSLLPLGISSP